MATGTTKISDLTTPSPEGVSLYGMDTLAESYRMVIDHAWTTSYRFWGQSGDLLRDARGTLLTGGLNDNGDFVGLFDYPNHYGETLPSATRTMMLSFDASQREEDEYVWQLNEGSLSRGRTVRQLYITPRGIFAHRQTFDSQGVFKHAEEDNAAELWGTINSYLENPALQLLMNDLRDERVRAEIHLAQFSVSSLKKFTGKKLQERIDDIEAGIKKIGFSYSPPIEPYVPEVNKDWDEADKAAFLERMAALRAANKKPNMILAVHAALEQILKIKEVNDAADSDPAAQGTQGVLVGVL